MAVVLPPTPDALDRAAAHLAAGQLVGLPTETVYGLAARALDPDAVARIYAAKDRPRFNPLIAHVAIPDLDAIDGTVVDLGRLTPEGRRVAHALAGRWPGPLTLVLPRGPAVPDLTTAGLDTVGVRCPDHPVARALLARVDGPLAAPSANPSGGISPTTAADVVAGLGDRLALVLDGGACTVGIESTVVHVAVDGTLTRLRPGAVTDEALTGWTGVAVRVPAADPDAPRSPGMTARHYAPSTPFLALPAPLSELDTALRARALGDARHVGLLTWSLADAVARAAPVAADGPAIHRLALTEAGDPAEAARNLFAVLRALDALGAERLLCEPCPPPGAHDGGLGHALRDRLGRATSPLAAVETPTDGRTG